jgi:phosphopentomutase
MSAGRVIFLMLDSLGVGASADAANYGDVGANTFGHIAQACLDGKANKIGVRNGALNIPNLAKRGLYHVAFASSGNNYVDLSSIGKPQSMYGYAIERSLGKDTSSGHWEIAGAPVMSAWGYFPNQQPCFPSNLMDKLVKEANLPGFLGDKHASGTDIIQELGDEHIATGKPIIYSSADSVLQIAAHEEFFGLDRLYDVCLKARNLVDDYNIGRVIARPFSGEYGAFFRTGNRHDYSMLPPEKTLLDYLHESGHQVIAIGKIADIFAHQGISQMIAAHGNMNLFDATLQAMQNAPDGSLIFTNFVDFDSSYGHRRDVIGYANALEKFDARLPELDALLKPNDLVIISADHGCDPTLDGSDHTREHIPVLVYGNNVESLDIGARTTFADIGQSIASYIGIEPLLHGVSFI